MRHWELKNDYKRDAKHLRRDATWPQTEIQNAYKKHKITSQTQEVTTMWRRDTKSTKNNSTNDYRDRKQLGIDTKHAQRDMKMHQRHKMMTEDCRGRQSKQTPSIVFHAAYHPDHPLLLVYAGAMQSCWGTHILEVRGHADVQQACKHHSSPQSGMGRWWWIVFSRQCVCVCVCVCVWVHVAVTNCVLMILFTDRHPAPDGGRRV